MPHVCHVCAVLCSLLVQLARDVQSDLHPHFGHLFVTLASLLCTQDAKCIEVPSHCVCECVCTCVLTFVCGGNGAVFCLYHAASVHLPGPPAQAPLETAI